ncbi:MAG: CRISPR system precrRNA processing endoribonuclease RAMP protein Cas6 [Bryobacteraceae bacterium]|nr:CRISPR system precrRNA processing endoribonuclease RAMP protein Cas6 [Bryobacteraceae bacterium]
MERGEELFFDAHLFDPGAEFLTELLPAFAYLAQEGFGPGFGSAELRRAELLELDGRRRGLVLEGGKLLPVPAALALGLAAGGGVERVRVRLVTPTEIKGEGFTAERPDFGPLLARIRDRVSNLAWLYGGERWQLEHRALGLAAKQVVTLRSELREVGGERRSMRSGQRHSLGGLAGEVEYGGDLGPFVSWLEAGGWTGVGRQTVWGKGELEVLVLE